MINEDKVKDKDGKIHDLRNWVSDAQSLVNEKNTEIENLKLQI